MQTTETSTATEAAAMPLETYIEAEQREFAHYARKLAELEQAADLEPGSLVDALLAGMNCGDAWEVADYVTSGWVCSQSASDMEAALRPLVERWEQEDDQP